MKAGPPTKALENSIAMGDRTPAGRYAVELATEEWWWSDDTYRIHGFEPGEVRPTTALVLAHKHPDDRHRVVGLFDDAQRTGEPFSTVHRIVDAHGAPRVVSVVGEARHDAHGAMTKLAGYVLDLTGSVDRLAAERADSSIRAAARSRRDIEQAKLLVTLALEVDDDEAFSVLRHHSNTTNVPLRALSQRLVREVVSAPDRPFEASRVLAVLEAPTPALH
ncbi:ANTAR domain-containing protein [Isoptericola sp. CG 20/1183]|uniref:histidine kinase n=1 Tax=Isoptericola halotolerans TaxID=300560 RepID=A0ABX5E9L1_9MICO|nr:MULTISPECIES: PAS and ANTAR domain-containing protein [Isoptericola]MCK0116490.1 PAS and ANTAR domain-containing protein [Isoptericola sp. S6320L]PRZ03035.1 ANTAR domain-containing protein [Isoptericola sp. CG 20/1183]PRZ03289.1 ANTAR domain-containing protein [Isoptericola halotolerans]